MQLVGIQIYNLDIARIKNQRNEIHMRHVLSIAAFCFRMYRLGRRLSSLKFSCNLFVIIHIVDGGPTDDNR